MRAKLPQLSKPSRALALAAFAVALSAAAVAYAGPSSEQPAPTPIARGVALDPANHPENYDRLPPEKKAVIDRENQLRNQALTPAAERTPRTTATRPPEPPIPDDAGPRQTAAGNGVLSAEGCEQLFPHIGLRSNQWFAVSDARGVLVCAGSQNDDESQGQLMVVFTNTKGTQRLPNQLQLAEPFFPTPVRAGHLTITGAEGDVLVVRAKDGTLFYFDVSDLVYVDAPKTDATPTSR